MSHIDAGTIVTIRDGGLVDGEARRHVQECVVCRAALADARILSQSVERALEALAPEVDVDLAVAKAEVRRRLDRRREATHRSAPGLLPSLGRAAGLLLVAAGVAWALPGSPVRDWLGRGSAPGSVEAPAPRDAATATAAEGIEVGVPASGLRIVLASVAPDATIEVLWSDDARATIVAGPGSRYAVSDGRAGVVAGPGPVRVTLPRAGPITIEVDGRMILRQADGESEVTGDVLSRSADRIVFATGGR